MKGAGLSGVKVFSATTPNWRGFLHPRVIVGVLHGPMDPEIIPWFDGFRSAQK
jgi:hypothetical protein